MEPIKLAFFGDAICTESRSHPNVKTFVDIILSHYGHNARMVHSGTAGGITEEQLYDQIRECKDMDIAFVFHCIPQGLNSTYQDMQSNIDLELAKRNIPCIHFVRPYIDNFKFQSGEVDSDVIAYTHLSPKYRVNTTYEVSDNAIDFVGNNLAAQRIIKFIDKQGK